jgi:TP53 regulating kinase-like protein
MNLISRGAEAEICRDGDKVVKSRVKKTYRISEIDDSLRRSRAKREAKVLEKLPKGILHPRLLRLDEKDASIEMEFIDGDKVRDILDNDIVLCIEIGRIIARMHNAGIIHGDLTTSNMMLKDRKIYMIDFGLSYFSDKLEDRAVDLHLLKQALESRHYRIFERAFGMVLDGYKEEATDYSKVLSKYTQVESRGRNKAKF